MSHDYQLTAPVPKTVHHVKCPHCEQPAGTIDHLKGRDMETMWYCDHCGHRYALKLTADGLVFTAKTIGKKDKALVLLRAGDVGLVVEGLCISDKPETSAHFEDGTSHHAYHYNEGTCPINYMKDVKAVLDLKNKDIDPHGIFQYVTTIPWNPDIEERNNDELLTSYLPLF